MRSSREIKRWMKLVTVTIGIIITVWSLRGGLGGGTSLNPMNIGGNGIAGICQEQQVAAMLSGQSGTTPQTLATGELTAGATKTLRAMNGGSLACPK